MEDINKNDIIVSNLELKRDEHLLVSFQELYKFSDNSSGSLYNVIDNSFYNSFNPLETITGQNLQLENYVYYYQVQLKFRGDGIIPNTVTIKYNNKVITDDGIGNLFDDNTKIGNVFYSSGIFCITDVNYGSITSFPVELEYSRFVYFRSETINIHIDANKYTNSSNSTFFQSDAPNPFLTKIYLMNDLYEVVGIAQINYPIEITNDMIISLDLISTY